MKYIALSIITLIVLHSSCSNRQVNKNNSDIKTPAEQHDRKKPQSPPIVTLSQKDNISLDDDSVKTVLFRQGRTIASRMQRALQKELQQAIKNGGAEQAISYCNSRAMPLTDSMSAEYDVEIRRLAKKYRNPENETDKAESEIYKAYIMDWIEKRPLYESVYPDEDGHPVYYRPIKVGKLCLNCHGKPGEHIPDKLYGKIKSLYPDDKAVNFTEGQLRGMWAITFKEYTVKQD